jgi:branched-chain amino acid transport system substrate-binding protein
VLPGKTKIDASVRQAIVAKVQTTTIDGATGKVAFDEFGDTTTKILTVYKVAAGAWKPEKTDTFK